MTTASTATSVVTPSSVEAVRDAVREAATCGRPVRIAGSGTWLDANRPVDAPVTLSMVSLSGVVEYVPGDLTLTARAGTTLAEIEAVTAAHGQWLTLNPFGEESATLGATIATASYGPLAHHFGTPRDVVLGVEFVSGSGGLVRGGGRVVKNVAGFDLTRLVTGSWGSLGVLTEVTVRLRARPEQALTLAVDLADAPERLRELQSRLRRLPFIPFSAELLDNSLAKKVGVGSGSGTAVIGTGSPSSSATLLIRIGGNAAAILAQRDELQTLGKLREVDSTSWQRLRSVEPARASVMRWSALPSRFADTWTAAARVAERWPGTLRHGDPGRGIVRCILPFAPVTGVADPIDVLRAALEAPFDGTRIYERLPGSLWRVCAPTRATDRLSRGVKTAFDPHHVLNPGILGESD